MDSLLARLLEECRLMFEHTGDPLDLKDAYRLCRDEDVPLRPWMWAAFDVFFDRLDDEECAASGRDGPFARHGRACRDYCLAELVRVRVDVDGNNETNAIMLVADREGVARSTVRRAWKKFQAVVRQLPPAYPPNMP